MPNRYTRAFKKKVVLEVKRKGASTKKTAEKYNVPLKTFEKWITKYNKEPEYFDKKIN